MCHIAFVGLQVFDSILLWGQKAVKDHNAISKTYRDEERTYLGKTPLSELVAHKAVSMFNEYCSKPLRNDAETNDKIWGKVWQFVPGDSLKPDVRRLMIALTLRSACSWHFRILRPCTSMPLQLLLLVELPCNVSCGRRVALAHILIDTEDCCLFAKNSDFAVKLKAVFRLELELIIATGGTCPRLLWIFMLLVRAQLPLDSQEIEGMHSILQRMAKAAPHMGQALASDRLGIKKGDVISPEECVAVHAEVMRRLSTDAHLDRFAELALVDLTPEPPDDTYKLLCPHKATSLRALATAMSTGCVKTLGLDLECSFAIGYGMPSATERRACLVGWSYYSTMYVAAGSVTKLAHTPVFMFCEPLSIQILSEWIASNVSHDLAGIQGKSVADQKLAFRRFDLEWHSLEQATITKETRVVVARPKVVIKMDFQQSSTLACLGTT